MPDGKQLHDHPGPYVRNHVIPAGMTVTDVAKSVGIGRPAVSNFLNGKSGLSHEMAAKLEKAFGVDAAELLKMQSAFDAGKGHALTMVSNVRAFVPPFLKAKANDIEAWADQHDSRAKLAAFLRILIHSTCDDLGHVDFPAHDDAQRPGWDGEVKTAKGCPWVPAGSSGWEFGTNKKIKEKADGDFFKSVKAVPGEKRKDQTFVFVTPRRWPGKDKWRQERIVDGQWKDVRVWDVSDLEQWLEQSVPAQVWFASEQGRDFKGTRSLDRCWVQWNADCDPLFTTDIFDEAAIIAGRKLIDHLKGGAPNTLRLAAHSVLEGVAFVYAMLAGDDPVLAEIRDRIVVFSEPGPLSDLATKSARFIPVVTTRETEVELSETGARLGGITIAARTMVQTEADIVLDTLSGEAFRKALESMNLGRDEIERLSAESGGSLTVLRRRLAQNPAIRSPEWSTNEGLARAVFPFLLAGAWKADNDMDQLILCHMAGCQEYAEVERKLGQLLALESTPVWSIGSFRGVVSKIDALYAVHNWVTPDELERFWAVAEMALSERDPSLDLPEKDRWAASMYGKTRDVSAALREGLADSLVVLAVHGSPLFKRRIGMDTQACADKLVRSLLEKMSADTLESQAHDFPRYAEAAPDEFLKILEADLANDDPQTRVLMRPVGDPIFSANPRVGLLWALEMLAWSPEYIARVVEILGKLVAIEPDDRSGNSPSQSLLSIFRRWMPQTAAPIEQRIAVFDHLVRHYPAVAWDLGKDQYDARLQTGHFNIKPKWRDFAFGHGEYAPSGEIERFKRHCIETALSWDTQDKDTLSDLIDSLEGMVDEERARVWELVGAWAQNASDEDRANLRERMRVGVSRTAWRRNRTGKPRSITDARVRTAREAYDLLEPDDLIWKHAWLFKNAWVEFSWEDIHGDDHAFEKRDKRIARQREDAVREVYNKTDFPGVIRLALSGNAPQVVGRVIAGILTREEQLAFVKRILAEAAFLSSTKLQFLLDGFLFSLGDRRSLELIDACRPDVDDEVFIQLLCLCRFGEQVWKVVEGLDAPLSQAYWKKVLATWGHQSEQELRYAVGKLLGADRSLSALHFVHLDLKSIESEQLYEILHSLPASEEANRLPSSIDHHTIQETFKILNARGTIDQERMARLEFMYLKVFRYERGNIPNLEAEVNKAPALYCDAIRLAYKGNEQNQSELRTEDQRRLAKNAYTFISAVSAVPGRDKDGNITAEGLKAWILDARKISDKTGHRNMLDLKLGELIANAPDGEDGAWPCEAVREAVNDLCSEDMARGMIVGRRNLRGAHWRGEGGGQEREIVEQYERWAKASDYVFPRMAAILRSIAKSYLDEAEWQDNEAMIRKRLRY